MTTEQKKIVQQIFNNNPTVDAVWINPKGEFFTVESYALNSLEKDEKGNRIGELKSIHRANKKK
ncbi:hypothetical protein [Tenacibaculum maritimum]|uniref:hypothetical protein n=1 Tax=Tenacibaculum maritimum TaxID=107401 RepID=UPI0012E4F435|nr:hypothetical protein [Tenacibaculum maritimum]CAA0222570.1 hypothetical protein TFA04_390020 [Tenacibaculum maritimum]